MADGESVFIREVQGADRLEVELGGSALPERGVELEVEQHLVQTHYPGSRVAHTQVLGPRRKPITLRGKLRDVWLGSSGAAQLLRTRLARLADRGRLCELSWGETFVARGYVRRANFRLMRAGTLDYEIEFQVDAADDAQAVAPQPFPEPGVDDLHRHVEALRVAARALDTALAANNVIRAVL